MMHWDYLRDVLEACESVGAYLVSFGRREDAGSSVRTASGDRAVLEWPGSEARITVESLFLPTVIRRLPNLNPKEAEP